ncbi:MAG: hypothetical protein ACI389_05340 [Methanobrevibacter sp.]|uniref:hypothetical protein n=1 Tax=Methanobrevibacter sp. TaxID=66852 RepID=UPI003EFCC7A5
MNKMEIELTDEQLEKVKKLESQDISVGQAIDMLFEAKQEVLTQIEKIEKSGILDKVSNVNVDNKTENLEENYGDAEKTYEMEVQNIKHRLKWCKDFFKF